MPVETGGCGDPRSRLVREKYFCLRPRPLERWLWSKRVPASAERVFWLHWQEGMQRGDWCSEIPLSRVARECQLDVSTVTRAYQLLAKLNCLRRTDQGRDPANPFQQATALTEVRIPRELLEELQRHPNRRGVERAGAETQSSVVIRTSGSIRVEGDFAAHEHTAEEQQSVSELREDGEGGDDPLGKGRAQGGSDVSTTGIERMALRDNGRGLQGLSHPGGNEWTCNRMGNGGAAHSTEASLGAGSCNPSREPVDPFSGLTGRERGRAISQLIEGLSPSERQAYQEALRMHQHQMAFDTHSKVPEGARCQILQLLRWMACSAKSIDSRSECITSKVLPSSPRRVERARKLSPFELGRLSRDLQSAASIATAPELMRQVVWSVETGALRRFDTRHALHIALKKIREGRWTRPHRMPPNWARALSTASAPESCGHA